MNAFLGWIEERIPMMRVANMHALQYPAPKNMNFWYVFGFLATIVLVNQIVTGIWLTMNFVPSSEGAFASCVRSTTVGSSVTCTVLAHRRSLLWYIYTCSVA